jgi:hypothetical protein
VLLATVHRDPVEDVACTPSGGTALQIDAPARHGPLTALPLQLCRALGTVALHRGATLLDLVAKIALDQRDLQPLARTDRAGECNLGCRPALHIQYTTGSGPPEPLTYCI